MSTAPAVFRAPVVQQTPMLPRVSPISFAFQPLVDARNRNVVGYEALVRGPMGEPARDVFAEVPQQQLGAFDERCRLVALRCAAELDLSCNLHLNLLPHTVQMGTDCLASTREAARRCGIALNAIVIEITEQEALGDDGRFLQLCELYRGAGMRVAFDDFGAGFSGLNLLAEFQPDELKLDMALVRNVARHGPRQAIVRGIVQVCRDLGIDLVAEGVETRDEFLWFCDEGVHLFQGYLFARPGFETLPKPVFPE